MSNLARPSSPRAARAVPLLDGEAELEALRSARRGATPLPALSPEVYARGHAAFELRSDQRHLIAEHLTDRLRQRATRPGTEAVPVAPGLSGLPGLSVLSVGCGDGTLDAALAAGLLAADPARPVRYVGIDPYAASAASFSRALAGLGQDRLDVEVHVADFADAVVEETFDVVTFVHSMYYVADVVQTLRRAHALLRPGGELVVLSAPRAGLNSLATVLAPDSGGHTQWFSEDVADALDAAGLPVSDRRTLDARLDLADASDDVLDFTVQARLTPSLRGQVCDYLGAVADPGSGGCRVAHPVDVYRVVRAA